MNEHLFQLNTDPFPMTSDPVFFPSRHHVKAESVLEHALESQAAFCLLTGEIGCGKSLLVNRLLAKLGDGVSVGLITHTHMRMQSITAAAAGALGVEHAGEGDSACYAALVTSIRQRYAKGRSTLLIVDEAQNLSIELLEELRLLSNINSRENVLQILLAGQPELRAKLSRPELLQCAQRISTQFHLPAFNAQDTHSFIRHRLQSADGNPDLFTPEAMDLIHARTGGVPRLINQLCHFVLAQPYAADRANVDSELIRRALLESWGSFALEGAPDRGHPARALVNNAGPLRALRARRIRRYAVATPVILAMLFGIGWWQLHKPTKLSATAAIRAAPATAFVATPAASIAGAAPTESRSPDARVQRSDPPASQPAMTPLPAAGQASARSGWFIYHASERLNQGDTAGAERLMQQASAAGARAEELADLRAGIDAQKLELRLMSAGDQIRLAIESNALLEPASDNAQTRYREMSALSPADPLTLRARRDLQGALLTHAQDAIHQEQFDLARRFISAAAGIGTTVQITATQEQLHDAVNRAAQHPTSTVAEPAAKTVETREAAAANAFATPGPLNQ